MKCFSKWFSAVIAVVVMANTAAAADEIVRGTVKSINADKKTFVMNDDGFVNKDVTVKLGDEIVINRNGTESKSDLKVGDVVNVCHDNGTFTWTAHYILVKEGASKDCFLVHGTVKTADAKELTFTDAGKDTTWILGAAKVSVNKEASKIADIKIGDKFNAIVEKIGDKSTLKTLMVVRK